MLGVTGASPQYGLLGEVSGRRVALDLNHTHTISLFGVQGGGKSYTLGAVAEMASLPIEGINQLPRPLATVIFHYSPTMDYAPEFTSIVAPNSDEAQVAMLRERYGAEPQALSDVVLLVPADKLVERRTEYPGIEVRALQFAAAELQASHWRFLMGAVGNEATYIRQLNRIMKQLRDDLTLAGLRQGIDQSHMPEHIKELVRGRIELAEEFIDDDTNLGEVACPVLFIMGNDDMVVWDPPFEHFRNIHGARVEVGAWNFVGYQYSLPFMGGIHEKPEGEVAADLAAIESLIDRRTVLVTHMPTFGVLDRTSSGLHVGSPSLRDMIQRTAPRAHLHGHVHGAFGRAESSFNVACGAVRIELEDLQAEVLVHAT